VDALLPPLPGKERKGPALGPAFDWRRSFPSPAARFGAACRRGRSTLFAAQGRAPCWCYLLANIRIPRGAYATSEGLCVDNICILLIDDVLRTGAALDGRAP
jgi:hypothetical protein